MRQDWLREECALLSVFIPPFCSGVTTSLFTTWHCRTCRWCLRWTVLAWSGQTWSIGHTPIWVRNVAVALALPGHTQEVGHG